MHIYERTEHGVEPRHFVKMHDEVACQGDHGPITIEHLRPATLRDFKKWRKEGKEVYPSVTTILDILDKRALTDWKITKHLEQAYRYLLEDYEASVLPSTDEYIAEIKRLTQLEMDKAPQVGTDFHKEMEQYLEAYQKNNATVSHLCCANTLTRLVEQCGDMREAEMEVSFVHELGFAGQADLVTDDWIIDYKTKATEDKFKPGKMAYPEHSKQLAAYRMGLGMPYARCANVFVCLETGEVDFHEHSEADLEKGWEAFGLLLKLWYLEKNII